jgi:hypothetical protein
VTEKTKEQINQEFQAEFEVLFNELSKRHPGLTLEEKQKLSINVLGGTLKVKTVVKQVDSSSWDERPWESRSRNQALGSHASCNPPEEKYDDGGWSGGGR